MLEQTDEIEIPDEEIRTDVYRSGGPGGQSVNTTDSAVRLTHIPTGTVVSCQNEKSQLQNKASAMVVLKAKLLALKKAEEKAHLDELRGDVQASWGDQMRNYVLQPLPDRQGPAHRLRGPATPASVFDGDLDDFLEAGIRWRRGAEKADGLTTRSAARLRSRIVRCRASLDRVIRFEKVTKTYPGQRHAALDNVTVDVEKGEFVFLVGASGSGKSTFLRLVLREYRARPRVASTSPARRSTGCAGWKVPRLRRQIGTVFQDFRLLPNKTVSENVAFALQVIGKPRTRDQQAGPRDPRAGRPRRQGRPDARRALRRRAAARRDRPRVRQPADDPDRRRAHRKPRPDHVGRHHEAARPHQPHRHDRA